MYTVGKTWVASLSIASTFVLPMCGLWQTLLINPTIFSHRTQAAIPNCADLLDEPNPMAFWIVCLLEDLWALQLQDFVIFCCFSGFSLLHA